MAVRPEDAEAVVRRAAELGEKAYVIGKVTGEEGVRLV